ncbi:uncharacterized protein L969DRAFT_598004 [Mixia osmundae IAM 14324]|uniref:Cystinosin n=1 Tax=Mixia osmundae (strain CBS 9802 / IAM 14324 / JCM 22182 / KY 12970) TaxID=764103 RepID=G7E4U8_MIXOS|nr:uncharacterized protein L969DRAFT_598004 [Mixia osmundae IAM 14324]KEI37721.1 hypothetical protein L969DRAFT_598004 [Mixia osmundae IAM 14324]GAA97858.1 hypothetical protein E5Q_04538 [Mixia osmundae IAM 14324]
MFDGLAVLSSALGVSYTVIWSLSFYPQMIMNWRRHSVSGLSIDFATINPIGHSCYFVFSTVLYASPVVRKEYADRHDGHLPQVAWNDVAFGAHAVLASIIIWLQTYIYHRDGGQRLSTFHRLVCAVLLSFIAFLAFLAAAHKFSPLDLMNTLADIKLYVSFSKYVPQAYMNWQRQSTVGWSIDNILMDVAGGVLSLAQLVLDAGRNDDWSAITGNPGKLGLALLSLAFDSVFLVQHYLLYTDAQSGLLHDKVADTRTDILPDVRADQEENTENTPLLSSSSSSS